MTLSANLLESLESVCTDCKLATYIKVAVIHFIFIYSLMYLAIVKCSCSLFVSRKNYKP